MLQPGDSQSLSRTGSKSHSLATRFQSPSGRTLTGRTVGNAVSPQFAAPDIRCSIAVVAVLTSAWSSAALADESIPGPAATPGPSALVEADSIQDILLLRGDLCSSACTCTSTAAGFRSLRRSWADQRFVILDADKSGFPKGKSSNKSDARVIAAGPGSGDGAAGAGGLYLQTARSHRKDSARHRRRHGDSVFHPVPGQPEKVRNL